MMHRALGLDNYKGTYSINEDDEIIGIDRDPDTNEETQYKFILRAEEKLAAYLYDEGSYYYFTSFSND